MPAGDQVVYFGRLHGMSRREAQHKARALLDEFGIAERWDERTDALSGGLQQRLQLATALVHDPDVIVLDEPFESVDPVSAANIRDILDAFAKAGGTVVVSSHSMDLVERMCDHVAIIAVGRVLVSGTMDEVRRSGDLETRFLDLIGGRRQGEGPAWLLSS